MNLQKYTPNYTLDVILFDNSFYILENTNINHYLKTYEPSKIHTELHARCYTV